MESTATDIYRSGQYLAKNPTWHAEDAPFKAKYISRLLARNNVVFATIADIGCGTGDVLRCLRSQSTGQNANWRGYDIAEDAIGIATQNHLNDGIKFHSGDLLATDAYFDVLLVIDVFEHVSDYLGFLRACRERARYKVYHIPLDLHVSAILRDSLTDARTSVGHLHYFSQKTAIATLTDTGHKIADTMLTPGAIELFKRHPSAKRAIANVPRMILGAFSASFATRLFGGYSLLALTE
jgi:SAM-dependent methyltransferase